MTSVPADEGPKMLMLKTSNSGLSAKSGHNKMFIPIRWGKKSVHVINNRPKSVGKYHRMLAKM